MPLEQMSPEAMPLEAMSLEAMINAANGEADPVLCNLKITLAHRQLSECLMELTGAEAGVNFHSWAVWGSKKAGVTIRQEDLDGALSDASMVAGITGAAVGLACSVGLMVQFLGAVIWWLLPPGAAVGAWIGAQAGRAIARWSRRRAAALVLAGNRLVLDDIGRQTARFYDRFIAEVRAGRGIGGPALEEFIAQMNPAPAEQGGQVLLQQAFREYARAASAADPKARHEAAYLANCLAILNEHIKLQPYIEGAMPFIVQRCVTQRMLCFDIGPLALSVSQDVPPLRGRAFPPTLETVSDAGLDRFLNGPPGADSGYAPKRDSLAGSGAGNWSDLRERMGYIVTLFRCFHLDASVLQPPYTPDQVAQIQGGAIPAGKL